MFNSYELMLIFRTDTSEEKRKKIVEEIKKVLPTLDKKFEVKDFGKRLLSYPIKKENEGNYYLLTLNMEGKEAANLNSKLKLNEDLLRYLLVRLEPAKKEKVKKGK